MATATNQVSTGAEKTMNILIQPVNNPPTYVSRSQLITGEAGPIREGATATIGGASSYATINGVPGSGAPTPVAGAHLVFGDNDNSSTQRQYRITSAAAHGQLLRNGALLGVGSVFTQDDLDSGTISYRHNGTETATDSFAYVVSDGDWIVNSTAASFPRAPPHQRHPSTISKSSRATMYRR